MFRHPPRRTICRSPEGSRPRCLELLLAVAVFALSLSGWPRRPARAAPTRLVAYVFLPLDIKASALEKILRDSLPELTVTVFGRFQDFEDAIASTRPEALVSIMPVLALSGTNPTLRGQFAGKDVESYVLASVEPVSGSLSGKTIGVVDLLGREGTQAFVAALLKTASVKVKRVAKVEDLLPLLEFSAADGILVRRSLLTRLMERTRLVLKIRELPGAEVSLPAVAVLKPSARYVVFGAFQKLDGATKIILGIDAWSAR